MTALLVYILFIGISDLTLIVNLHISTNSVTYNSITNNILEIDLQTDCKKHYH